MSSRSSKIGKAFQGIQKRPIPNEMETEGLTPHTPPHPATPPPTKSVTTIFFRPEMPRTQKAMASCRSLSLTEALNNRYTGSKTRLNQSTREALGRTNVKNSPLSQSPCSVSGLLHPWPSTWELLSWSLWYFPSGQSVGQEWLPRKVEKKGPKDEKIIYYP